MRLFNLFRALFFFMILHAEFWNENILNVFTAKYNKLK